MPHLMSTTNKTSEFSKDHLSPTDPQLSVITSFPNTIIPSDVPHSPYAFQVAGHGALLKLPGNKICKPFIPIEFDFYDSLRKCTSGLLPFTARYFGTIDLEFTDEQIKGWEQQVSMIENEQLGEDKKRNFEVSNDHLNPWSAKVTKIVIEKMQKSGRTAKKYLVLEDLTCKFIKPSILDIKLGTRQHGDDASAEKKKRHMAKCASTTSQPLGIRICGQLVYQPSHESYRHTDKYFGRKLTSNTIESNISEFFNNGYSFRKDALDKIILKLRELYRVMDKEQNHYRFYSTSLLLIYEGDLLAKEKEVDIRMIDFAHTFGLEEGEEQDDGYLFGLKNFIQLMENIQKSREMTSNSENIFSNSDIL